MFTQQNIYVPSRLSSINHDACAGYPIHHSYIAWYKAKRKIGGCRSTIRASLYKCLCCVFVVRCSSHGVITMNHYQLVQIAALIFDQIVSHSLCIIIDFKVLICCDVQVLSSSLSVENIFPQGPSCSNTLA